MDFIFRKANLADTAQIWQIILQAKEQMRRMNSRQWQDGYPALENISSDIAQGYGYVLCGESGVMASGAVSFDGEPAYQAIQGQWLTDRPYVVVHRLAVADEVKNRGVATLFMQKVQDLAIQSGVGSFRVDTNFDNLYMHKVLHALGFTYCGEIFYEANQRRAYEKKLCLL